MIDYKKHRERLAKWRNGEGIAARVSAPLFDDIPELLDKAEKSEWFEDKWNKYGRILMKIRERNEPWVEEIILADFREEHGLATEKKNEI